MDLRLKVERRAVQLMADRLSRRLRRQEELAEMIEEQVGSSDRLFDPFPLQKWTKIDLK